jgi:hypothetical protein
MSEYNPFVEVDSEVFHFIKHHHQEMTWYSGKESLDSNYFMVDVDTMKLGWGKWSATKGYEYYWQDDLYTAIPRPGDDFSKAFSVWVLPKWVGDDNSVEHDPKLWRRHSFGEYKGFMNMGACFFNELKLPENKGKLPIVKHTESEKIGTGNGGTSIPHFELVGFKERPDTFVLPAYGEHSEGDNSPVNLTESPSESKVEERKPIVDDEIPF